MSAPPPLTRDWAILSPNCGNCGRELADPRTHWHDMCHPWSARIVVAFFVLVEVALLAWLIHTVVAL